MAVVHSYVRFSTPGQIEGDSLRRQKKAAEEFCQKHNHTLSNLVFHDLGRSAFRDRKQKALDRFLQAIKDGDVRPGEMLLVEAVDRLSRKGIRPTQDLVNRILNSGVDIAILTPIEKVYRAKDKNDIGGAIELAAFAYQANVYSDLLSGRIKNWWEEARRKARENGTPVSGPIPSWLIKTESGFKTDPVAVETVRFIFHRTIEGVGSPSLCEELNAKYKPIARTKKSKHWNKTLLRNLIRDRAVRGEYQPHEIDENGKRQPVGEVIEGYYIEIVDEQTWLAANRAMSNRSIERGPTGNFVNLFTGLVWYVPDDCPAHIYTFQQTRADGHKVILRRLKSYKAKEKVKGASTATVDLVAFEKALLRFLSEIDPAALESKRSNILELVAAQEEIARKESRISELDESLSYGGESVKSLLAASDKLRAELRELKTRARELTATNGSNTRQDLENVRQLHKYAESPENRQKLREIIKRVVKRINIWPEKLGPKKKDHVACMVEVIFHAGHRRFINMLNGKSAALQFPIGVQEEDEQLGALMYRLWKQYVHKGKKGVGKKGMNEDTVLFKTTATVEFETVKKPRNRRKAR
jgi:DNA invertase Pin-like site-specific DNA recombinase